MTKDELIAVMESAVRKAAEADTAYNEATVAAALAQPVEGCTDAVLRARAWLSAKDLILEGRLAEVRSQLEQHLYLGDRWRRIDRITGILDLLEAKLGPAIRGLGL